MCAAEAFSFGHRLAPRQGMFHKTTRGNIRIHSGESRMRVGLGDWRRGIPCPKNRQTNGITQFVPLEYSEGKRLAAAFHKCHSRGRVAIAQAERR
jgi:hypothetical protein